jgi:hypothetical protein
MNAIIIDRQNHGKHQAKMGRVYLGGWGRFITISSSLYMKPTIILAAPALIFSGYGAIGSHAALTFQEDITLFFFQQGIHDQRADSLFAEIFLHH